MKRNAYIVILGMLAFGAGKAVSQTVVDSAGKPIPMFSLTEDRQHKDSVWIGAYGYHTRKVSKLNLDKPLRLEGLSHTLREVQISNLKRTLNQQVLSFYFRLEIHRTEKKPHYRRKCSGKGLWQPATGKIEVHPDSLWMTKANLKANCRFKMTQPFVLYHFVDIARQVADSIEHDARLFVKYQTDPDTTSLPYQLYTGENLGTRFSIVDNAYEGDRHVGLVRIEFWNVQTDTTGAQPRFANSPLFAKPGWCERALEWPDKPF